MSRIAIDQDVRAVAAQLGVPLRTDPTALIIDRCVARVAGWAAQYGPVATLQDLISLVCEKLCLRFEVAKTDSELEEIKRRYLQAKEMAFAELDTEFNASTDAVVIRLRNAAAWSNVRYVAVIDGRGKKQYRIWFSKWHEIAHLLAEPQTKFVFRRTQAFKREPIERLMDNIAGALAFYEPLFLPRVKAHGLLDGVPELSALCAFSSLETPFASLQATISAILRHHDQPLILVEAKRGRKVGQAAEEAAALRAVTTTHNPPAMRAKIYLHRNMRVPRRSVISRVFSGDVSLERTRVTECLSWVSVRRSAPAPRRPPA